MTATSPSIPTHLGLPATLSAFARRFADEDACWQYLVQLRWPKDQAPRHPVTGERPCSFRKDRRFWRFSDGTEQSVQTGTVLERSRVPLNVWFWAAYQVVTNPAGISARHIAEQFQLRYEVAYQLLQRLRAGLVDPDRQPLHGVIEMDVVAIGCHRNSHLDTPVIAAVEVTTTSTQQVHLGRMRLRAVREVTTRAIRSFAGDHLSQGVIIRTDDQPLYTGLAAAGYRHHVVAATRHAARRNPSPLRHIQQVLAGLEAWLQATHGGAVSPPMPLL